ncbi:hypothetical protein LTR08_003788 [Meristemomyces frigidus]|nr:hypothetical protein LTR08_003788 [Meristemomyces frigidus]
MADYFSEYSSFVGAAKGLPSPADTPYETPGFIRSKRSSRATADSSRERSCSPPPLPPDSIEHHEKSREGRYPSIDPRRFTPTLHASLVSEILNLRRELDSKNHLVEDLETSLSTSRNENESLNRRVLEHVKEVRKTKQQVQHMENDTYQAVQDLVKEKNAARHATDELRTKLEAATKKTRWQGEDATRTQRDWEHEKEGWENERRELERRVHVTENRLRVFVDEVTAQQAELDAQNAQMEETGDESNFKDSGLGNESDTASIKSATPAVRHRRNMSSLSNRTRSLRNSGSTRASTGTPEPHARAHGYSLADELDIDEEDEYDLDVFEHPDDDLEFSGAGIRAVTHSSQGSVLSELDSKAKRVLGLTSETPDSPVFGPVSTPTKAECSRQALESPLRKPLRLSMVQIATRQRIDAVPRAEYVDKGYQPSPPSSPRSKGTSTEPMHDTEIREPDSKTEPEHVNAAQAARHALQTAMREASSPVSPPETPIVDGVRWHEDRHLSMLGAAYSTASTQTEVVEPERPKSMRSNRDSLSPPDLVPSIAIHPPTSRPTSPRTYVLPPRTKNASSQADLPWQGRDACVQTEVASFISAIVTVAVALAAFSNVSYTSTTATVGNRPHCQDIHSGATVSLAAIAVSCLFEPRNIERLRVQGHSWSTTESDPSASTGTFASSKERREHQFRPT